MKSLVTGLIALAAAALLLVAGLRRTAGGEVVRPTDLKGHAAELAAFRQFCGQCHPAPDPRSHRKGEWPSLVRQMHQRAEGRGLEDPVLVELAVKYLKREGR